MRVAKWSVGYTGSNETVGAVSSNDTFERGTLVEALDGRLSGDFSSCTFGFSAEVFLSGGGSARPPLIEFASEPSSVDILLPSHVNAAGDVTEVDRGLVVVARCQHVEPETGDLTDMPVPTFELSVKFRWTDRKATKTTASFQ